jgi:hypothetical protein
MSAVDEGGRSAGRRRPHRVRRAVAVVLLIGGLSAVADGRVASGEATPEVWEPPVGKVYAGPPGDGPHPDDDQLEVGDLVARGTRGADGECYQPPGGVGVGFTPPPGHAMHVSVGTKEGTCDWVVKTIEVRPSTGEEEKSDCPEVNTPEHGCLGPEDVPGGVPGTAPAQPELEP